MKKSFWRTLFETNQIVQIVGLVIVAFLVWGTVGVVQRNYKLQQQVDRLNDEIAILELENQQLQYNIEYYQTDEYLELSARELFNKKAPGERVIALPKNDPPAENTTTDPSELQTESQSNFQQWLDFLFGA
jgi:cell division protein FtsB